MVGLALAGGGVKGSYQIGAYMAFKKCHIKFDGVCGTSIGSFNAAMIAAGREEELLDFWLNADIGKILGYEKKYVDLVNSDNIDELELLKSSFDNFVNIIKNKGISIEGLQSTLKDFNLEPDIRNSKMDFGLITYRLKDFKPLELFKEVMKKGSINNYIISSCYLPVFKMEKLEEDSYYFDGGIYDNCPANMMLKKGYDKVYRVELKGMGFKKKLIDKDKVITIVPTRKLSSTLTVNKKAITENIQIGYFDTIKVLKNYPGERYIFKKSPNWYYDFVLKNVSDKDILKYKTLFNVKDNKSLVIKLIEYAMEKDEVTYFNIYSLNKMIKKYKNSNQKYGIYRVIKDFKSF